MLEKRSRILFSLLCAALLCGVLCCTGCDDDDDDEGPSVAAPTPGAVQQTDTTGKQPTEAATEEPVLGDGDMVTLTDPTENAFTVQMPKGWKNQAFLIRQFDQHRSVATSLSPDGETVLFFGDPKIPIGIEPTPQINANTPGANLNPLIKYTSFVPAENYFPQYVKKKYGDLPGFRLGEPAPDPGYQQLVQRKMEQQGSKVRVTTLQVPFSYTDNGKPMRALIHGTTVTIGGAWIVDLCGVSTTDDPKRYTDLIFRIVNSYKPEPNWTAKEKALQEQRMEEIREYGRKSRENLAEMTRRHEARMAAIHSAGEASMQRWYQSQAASDASHRRFLNYITEENTVVNSSGTKYQVDNRYQRYYVNKNNNSYIGTGSTVDRDDLRKSGVNPDDYEEVKIVP